MSQVVIENPIINSPFDEPTRHFRFTDEGITNEIVDGRRTSSYFVPIAQPKKKGTKQLHFDTEWTRDRIEENKLVNDIRRRVALWQKGGYVGVTPTTAVATVNPEAFGFVDLPSHQSCFPEALKLQHISSPIQALSRSVPHVKR